MAVVGISLGSNLGDRLSYLSQARERLKEVASSPIDRVSSLFETAPIDCAPGDPAFLNAVIELDTKLPPLELLAFCQEVEKESGRPGIREKNAPRPLDLDLLYYDDLEIETEELILPHPRMSDRGFVLLPLAEIRPDLVSEEKRVDVSDGVSLWKSSW